MKKIGFIPIRKGSKGIPNKNIRLFCNKPLYRWCLDTLMTSNSLDEIWIATDSEEVIQQTGDLYPQVKIYRRSERSARDEAPTIEVVLEFLHQHEHQPDDWFLLFQATSPLTSQEDIQKLLDCIDSGQYDSALSCLRMKRFRWTEDGTSLDYALDAKPRRQDYPGFLVETGSFYASKIGAILDTEQISSGKTGIVEVGEQAIIDIDEPVDWMLGEAYCSFMTGQTD